MARMYSRNKGKSKSTQPAKRTVPSWVSYSAKEVELLIVKYAKEGKTPSQIGLYLRDEYGIPSVKAVVGTSIERVLDKKKMKSELPEDILALMRKVLRVKEHIAENNQDKDAKRGLTLTESKILRLIKYYKSSGRISKDWNYNPKHIKMYVE